MVEEKIQTREIEKGQSGVWKESLEKRQSREPNQSRLERERSQKPSYTAGERVRREKMENHILVKIKNLLRMKSSGKIKG